jgi:hypothetical protein
VLVPALIPAALLAGVAGPSRAATQGAPEQGSAVEPQARDALNRMSDAFKALNAFAVHQEITREQVIDGDLKVQKSSTADVLVRRPDRMKADVTGDDDKNHSIYYDGKTLTAYVPAKKYFAQTAAPDTIGATIDMAESKYGVEFPAPDLLRLVSGGDEFTRDLTAGGDVGKSRVGGDECDHFAYRSGEVDYQLWIQTGDKPLLRKLVITSKKVPAQPEYSAVFTWSLAPSVDDAAFVFTPPEGASKIALADLTSSPAPAKNPPSKAPHK